MEAIIRQRNVDRVKAVTPEKLVAGGVCVDHDSPPMLGGVFLDKNGWNFWVATVESGGRVAVQAGLATVLSPRYVLPEDRDVVECVSMALDSIKLSLETNAENQALTRERQ